ncbi:hypothetical protein LTS10_002807 [Elasticomyces elasticus]|nr:hypothetical protein LTS10_002807 [Elasticomyces elasticus]
MTSTTDAARRKTFLDLPAELRNAIYTLTLGQKHYYRFLRVRSKTRPGYMVMCPSMPGIVNTRQQITDEVLSLFYSSHAFVLRDDLDMSLFLTVRGRTAKKHMKHIIIDAEKCEPNTSALPITKFFDIVVETKEGGGLDIHLDPNSQNECMCEIMAEMGVHAIEKCSDSNGDYGLAFAAAEYFFDKHSPRLQDKAIRSTASRIACSEFVYKRNDFMEALRLL